MAYAVSKFLDEIFVRSERDEELVKEGCTLADTIGPDDLPGDWRVEWEERAAIMEYDGGLPRERAEALALQEIVVRMQKAHSATEEDS